MLNITPSKNNSEKNWIDCRINSLYNFLLYYGIDISRDYIYLLSEAYSYYYIYTNLRTANISNVPFAAASESNLEIKTLSALGFQIVMEKLDDSDNSLNKMKELVNQKKKPILMHTVEYMFIRHVEVLEKLKINIRMQSIPILLGFDEKDDYIMYWSSTNQKDSITVRKKREIDHLRSIECVPYAPNYWCVYVANVTSNFSSEYLVTQLHKAIKNVTKKMIYGVDIDSEAIKNLNASEAYIGLKAMEKMKCDLQSMLNNIPKCPDDAGYRKKCYLYILITKIGLFKGSNYSFRKEFGSALTKFADEIADKSLSDIAIDFTEIAICWRKLFVIISKMKLANFDALFLRNVYNAFNDIYEKECKVFYKLATYYEISEEYLC